MPLSNEFSDSRLSYLQDAIKNTEIVTQQFYPRFVREYNEQFPYTEQRLSNVLNPNANNVVKNYLNSSFDNFQENLLLKLNTLTNDDSISSLILNGLKTKLIPSELKYYNDNFNTVQKKVRIPYEGISKEDFVEQVVMALANDNHKNDISAFNKSRFSTLLPSTIGLNSSLLRPPSITLPSPTKTSSSGKSNVLLNMKKRGRPPGSKNKPKIYADAVLPELEQIYEKTGNGIKKTLKPLIFKDRVIKHKKVFNNKYAIDIKKLKTNILDLKYLKNANHVATFQPIEISSYLKNIIENIIKDNYNIQKEDFIHLNNTEKRILKRLFNFLKIKNDDDVIMDYDYNIQKRFEVAYGSFLAGNTNKELIQELKDYIKLALHESTINKTDGQLILKKLNNNK